MPKFVQYLILLLLLGALSVFFYQDVISLVPCYNHAWTQSDKLALAYGFLDNNFNIFKPQTFNLITKGGVTGVDFPLHEYIVASILKLLGTKNPMIFRLYSVGLSWIGFIYLFRLSKLITRSYLKSLLVVGFAFLLPILTYYQAGFLPSTNALSTSFIGLFYYFYFRKNKQYKYFYLGLFFVLLAALVRTTFSIFLFGLLLEQIVSWINKKALNRKELGAFLTVISLVIVSNIYKVYLNRTYGTIFLNSLMPPDSFTVAKELTEMIWTKWYLELMTKYHYVLLGVSALSLVVYGLKPQIRSGQQNLLLRLAGLFFLGAAAFFVLMMRQFIHHEYYFIDSFYLGVILFFLAGLSGLTQRIKAVRFLLPIIGIALLVGAAIDSKSVQILKNNLTLGGTGETTIYNYTGADVYLDSLGISRMATVLAIDGYSPNEPLILMGRKGYSTTTTREEKIKKFYSLDIDYVVQQNTYLMDVFADVPSLVGRLKRIDGNEKLTVFKFQEPDEQQKVWQLLTNNESALESIIDFESGDPTEGWFNTMETTSEVVHKGDFGGVLTEEYGPTFMWEDHYFDFKNIVFEGFFYAKEVHEKVKLAVVYYFEEKEVGQESHPIKIKVDSHWTRQQYHIQLPKNIEVDKIKVFLWNPDHHKIYFDDIVLTLF